MRRVAGQPRQTKPTILAASANGGELTTGVSGVVKPRELVAHVLALEEYEDQFRDLLDPAHRVTLIVLEIYGHGFTTGRSHEMRRINANKFAEQGRHDEVIHQLRKLLTETKDAEEGSIHEFAKRVEEDLRRTRETQAASLQEEIF